jgi:DNA-binding MarR family transcriptional regulator
LAKHRSETTRASLIASRENGDRLPLWSRPGYLIRRLHQIHHALFLDECRSFRITPVQYGLLTVLSTRPGIDQVTLAAELGIDRTNVADVLARLAARGLVRRASAERDKRVKLAFLTVEGARLTGKMYEGMHRSQERLIAPLSPAERRKFMAMLTRLVEASNQHGRALLRPS